MPFSTYMEKTLYGREGYYMVDRNRFGHQGDFSTSAQISPVFGEIWAHFFTQWCRKSGLSRLSIVELGCGDGHLAEAMMKELLKTSHLHDIHYVGVDLSPIARQRTLDRLHANVVATDIATVVNLGDAPECLPTRTEDRVVIGNEILDALPCDVVRVWASGLVERMMVEQCGEGYKAYFEATNDVRCMAYARMYLLPLCEKQQHPFVVAEVSVRLPEYLRSIVHELHPAQIIFIDYGGFTEDIVSEDRPHGSIRAYRHHELIQDFLNDSGSFDLTYDVNFEEVTDILAQYGYLVNRPVAQGAFLLGVEGVQDFLVQRMAIDPSTGSALKQLVLPGGFGDRFFVLVATMNTGADAL